MSHFFLQVILTHESPWPVKQNLERLLAPYSEHLEVAEHLEKCWCINGVARREVGVLADKEFGTGQDLRARFDAQDPPLPMPKVLSDEAQWIVYFDARRARDERWTAFVKPRDRFEAQATKLHPMAQKPDPDCGECKGAGEFPSSSNPRGYWDWFVIGGRWNGVVSGGPGHDRNNPAPLDAQCVDGNVVLVEKVADLRAYPYAIVTPDGEWHQRGEMRAFGFSANEEPEERWRARVDRIWAAHPGHYVVGVDCHT